MENTKETIKYINNIISSNNPVGLISSLKNQGIEVPTGATEIILSSLLDVIFNTDKSKWVAIIKNVSYNENAGNWTSSDAVKNDLLSMVNIQTGSRFDLSGILTQVGDFLGGSSTSGGGSTTTTNSISGTTAAIVTIIVIAIIGLIIWKA